MNPYNQHFNSHKKNKIKNRKKQKKQKMFMIQNMINKINIEMKTKSQIFS